MREMLDKVDFNFSNRPGVCIVCGGALTEYEKQFDYPDHVNRANCVIVLQNTLKLNNDNDDHSLALIGALAQFIEKNIPDLKDGWFEKIDAEVES